MFYLFSNMSLFISILKHSNKRNKSMLTLYLSSLPSIVFSILEYEPGRALRYSPFLPARQVTHSITRAQQNWKKTCFLAAFFQEENQQFTHSQVPPRFSCSFIGYGQKQTLWLFFFFYFFVTKGTEVITVGAGACLSQTRTTMKKNMTVRKCTATVSKLSQ